MLFKGFPARLSVDSEYSDFKLALLISLIPEYDKKAFVEENYAKNFHIER